MPKAKDADIALVFFSGHGAQYKDNNYLVPIENNKQWNGGAPIGFEAYINLQAKVYKLKDIAKTRILLVDACRTGGRAFDDYVKRYGEDEHPTNATEGMYIAFASLPKIIRTMVAQIATRPLLLRCSET